MIILTNFIFSQYAGLFDDAHQDCPNLFKKLPESMHLFLKLENCQTTGSFKIRGVASQLHAAKRILAKGGTNATQTTQYLVILLLSLN